MSRFLTVCIETWKKQIKSISFWIMILMPFIIILVAGIVGYFSSSGQSDNKVAIVTDSNLEEMFVKNEVVDFVFEDIDKAKEDVDKGEVSAYAIVEEKDGQVEMQYYSSDMMSRAISVYLESLVKGIQDSLNYQRANLSTNQAKIITTNPNIEYHQLENTSDSYITMAAYFVSMFAMYMFLIVYSNIMIMDVAVEKGTKMLEFIFSSVKSSTYFAGKIAGNLLLILTHALIYVVVGAIGVFAVLKTGILERFNIDISLSPHIYMVIILMLAFVIVGVLLYMIVAATLGSLVSKQEDASKAGFPIIIIPIICYIISMMFMTKGPNLFIKILSFIPFVSTFFMPMRLIYSDASLLTASISLVILILSVIVIYIICAKIYKTNILNYSSGKLFGRKKVKKVRKNRK